MSIGFWQIAIVVVLVVLLFGRGKISSLMGDVAKGIKSFKKGMSDNPNQTGSISSSEETSKASEETSKTSEEASNEDQNSEKK
jgi:sec-independent protein translocase protein TatA